jgi:WD40 repeat protein
MSAPPDPPAASCSRCGQPLVNAKLEGVCPACLWTDVFSDAENIQTPGDAGTGLRAAVGLLPIPGHEVQEEIARGGMGIVYRARQLEPPRTVALKMLLPHQSGLALMRERFRLEIQAASGLDHPAILPLYQVGEQDGLPWFTMKLAGGGSLVTRRAALAGDCRGIAELLATLADAMQFAHERGVLHRDLKPGNILFDEAGRPYVSDFGLAKVIGENSDLTRSVDFLGTPHYAAPEVVASSARNATTASDIYSLGAILYELLAGRTPFEAESMPALLRKIAEEVLVTRQLTAAKANVPRDLAVICLKCLAKEPARRYATARELADDLRRWLAGKPILARPATRLERVGSWARRNPAVATLSLLLIVVLVGVVIVEARSNRRLQQSLTESLLTQARMQRGTGRAGQRFETLTLVQRAAETGGRKGSHMTAQLRTEAAAALTLPDLRLTARWPVATAHFENEFDFTSALDRYAAPTTNGGFGVFNTGNRQLLWESPGSPTNPPVKLRISPDGRWLAVRFQDGHAELFSVMGNASPRSWNPHENAQVQMAFSPQSDNFVVSYRDDGSGWITEVVSLVDARTAVGIPTARGASALTFDLRAGRLAMASTTLEVFRLPGGNPLWTAHLTNDVSSLTWSADGRLLAVSVNRHTASNSSVFASDPVVVFNAADGSIGHRMSLDEGTRVERLAFHPNGESIVLTTWSGEMIWQWIGQKDRRLVREGVAGALAFSADGRRLAFAPSKTELGLLDIALPEVWSQWTSASSPAGACYTLATTRDGRWLVSAGKTRLQLWDAVRRTEIASLSLPAEAWYTTVLFGPGDEFLYVSAVSFGVRRIELVRTRTPDGQERLEFGPMRLIGEPKDWIATYLAADGRSLIMGQHRRRSANERIPPTVWLWPEADPSRARKLVEDFPLTGFTPLPGGRWAVSTDLLEPDFWLWNIETGERIRKFEVGAPAVCQPAPNGRWLVSKTRDEFDVWEIAGWKKLHRWPARPDEIHIEMAISPDSRFLASIGASGDITLRSLPTGEELLRLPPPQTLRIVAVTFSPDAKRLFLLSATGQVFEWNLAALRVELAKLGLDWE